MVQQIESTDDLNQLSKWLDGILEADTLTAMGLVLETEQNQ